LSLTSKIYRVHCTVINSLMQTTNLYLLCHKAKGRLEVYLNLRIRKPAVIFETICLKGMTIA